LEKEALKTTSGSIEIHSEILPVCYWHIDEEIIHQLKWKWIAEAKIFKKEGYNSANIIFCGDHVSFK
jgi:hypothetical protein